MHQLQTSYAPQFRNNNHTALIEVLKPDWDLLDRHYWRRDFQRRYGGELEDSVIDDYAGLASAVLGQHPDSLAARDTPSSSMPAAPKMFELAATTQTCAAAHRACYLSGRPAIECLKALHSCNQGLTTIFGPGIVGAPKP